ncbi:MAG: ABC transporter ATP-binding protein [Deltaproteobacteria bacterium]|jgi:iron complex transport system ATP-binding protein|nr:ABC transporter ATP-binding protein [Deltaproteobacteria bacterium]
MSGLLIEGLRVVKAARTILDLPSLDLGGEGLVAVVGPNGAGKSTLLKVLAGAERADAGRALWGGRDLLRMPGRERAALAGYVPQHFVPSWNQKVFELLEMAEERAAAAPGLFGGAAEEFELSGILERDWDGLSGGERARVLLAMALGSRPPVIIADEPCAAMDAAHALRMLEAFRTRAEGSLIIVAIHDLGLAVRFFPRIIVLKDGKVAWDGAPDGLYEAGALDRAFGVRFRKVECEEGFLIYPASAL